MHQENSGEARLGKVRMFVDQIENTEFDRLRKSTMYESRKFRLAGTRPGSPPTGAWLLPSLPCFISDDGDRIDLLPLTDEDIFFVIDETIDCLMVEAMMADNGLTICCETAQIRGPRALLEEVREFVEGVLFDAIVQGGTFGCPQFKEG